MLVKYGYSLSGYPYKNELNDMLKNKRLLVVGGTGRDVGKTEFVCKLMGKISEYRPVYALKVSAIFPDEELYHGHSR